MIPIREIREVSRALGVPESTIERDYAQNWFLGALFTSSNDLVLKGGTGIRKTYIEGYRFSDDLDFTVIGEYDGESVRDFLSKSIIKAKEESGIDFGDDVNLKENINGFEGRVYFKLLRRAGSPLGIKLDLTRSDMEMMVLPPQRKRIIHSYSDDPKFEVMVYTLKEILGEKIRSLFERTRPRDLYDVWYFKDELDDRVIFDILTKKCVFKKLEPEMGSLIKRRDDFRGSWENSLSHQLRYLPNFDEAYDDVIAILSGFL